ncbi:MAG: TlpA family protein disulfide reductase [Candidatus Rokubacteria bacterium]|nr:TlpA family protein disulfide reductase [Candidatus Rokubacteria bacterium]
MMRAWAPHRFLGTNRRETLIMLSLFLALMGAVWWFLPTRKVGEEGSRYHHARTLDPYEKAGVTEFKEGQRGPEFRLKSLEGKRVSLKDYQGKLVVLNFWATWCTPCEVEMPALENLWVSHREKGLVVVGITVDRGGPRSLIEPYVKGKKLTFPILLDPDMRTAQAWRVTAIPTTFLVRPDGEVAGVSHGAREWDGKEMVVLLETLLPPGAHPAR